MLLLLLPFLLRTWRTSVDDVHPSSVSLDFVEPDGRHSQERCRRRRRPVVPVSVRNGLRGGPRLLQVESGRFLACFEDNKETHLMR